MFTEKGLHVIIDQTKIAGIRPLIGFNKWQVGIVDKVREGWRNVFLLSGDFILCWNARFFVQRFSERTSMQYLNPLNFGEKLTIFVRASNISAIY